MSTGSFPSVEGLYVGSTKDLHHSVNVFKILSNLDELVTAYLPEIVLSHCVLLILEYILSKLTYRQ